MLWEGPLDHPSGHGWMGTGDRPTGPGWRSGRRRVPLNCGTADAPGAQGTVHPAVLTAATPSLIGLIVIFALNFDLPYLSDTSLGIILIVVDALALILSLVVNAQRSRSRHRHPGRRRHHRRAGGAATGSAGTV